MHGKLIEKRDDTQSSFFCLFFVFLFFFTANVLGKVSLLGTPALKLFSA